MSLDHHDYQEDTQESIPSAEHQEIDVNTIDNINEEQSKNDLLNVFKELGYEIKL